MGLLFIFQAGAMLGLGPLITREVALDNSATGSWLSGSMYAVVPRPCSIGCYFRLASVSWVIKGWPCWEA